MRKLLTAFRVFRSSGLSGLAKAFREALFSRANFCLLERVWSQEDAQAPRDESAISFRPISRDDLEAVADAWPADYPFPAADLGKLRQALLERLEGDIPGFVARSGKELAGAVWCKPWCHDDALPADRRGRSAYEVFNLFTVPQARGKGIAQMLLLFAMESMAQRGKTVAFSFIFPHRVGSIVAHERVGFRKVGVMTFGAFLGRRYSRLDASAV